MKKLLSFSLGIIMVLTTFFCLPFCVWADDEGSLGYIKNKTFSTDMAPEYNAEFDASSSEKLIAEDFRASLVARDNSYEFSFRSDVKTEDDLYAYCFDIFLYAMSDEISVSCVDGDYLFYQWYSIKVDYEFDEKSKEYSIFYDISYRSESYDEYGVDGVVKEFLSGIDTSKMSDYDILKAIHDYILDICTYNFYDMSNPRNYIAAGVFVDGTAVCQGYAVAFYRLCSELGYDVRVVTSDDEGNHAWNLVYIGDAYYFVDTTWDDDRDDIYKFFLVDYETLQSEDSRDHEHRLDADVFDTEYFNSNYGDFISDSVYDSTAKSIGNCIIDVNYENPLDTVVKDSNRNALAYGKDYTITYSDDCYLTVVGMGDYENTKSKRMLTIDGASYDCEYTYIQYDGMDKAAPKVSLDGYTLGQDYIVSYPDFYGPDEYYNVIQGIGKYTGVIFVKFEIAPIDINTLGITQSFTQTYYNGKPQQPEIYFEGAPDKVDYYILEEPQTKPGAYEITVCGIFGYTGEVVLSYEILKAPVSILNISLSSDSFIYDGRAKEPKVLIDGLIENRDYTVYYGDNISTGVASVTIAGMGYYEGTKTVYFYILPQQTRVEILSTTSSSVTLKWRSVADASGYKIEICDANGWRDAGDVDADQATFTVSGLQSYTAYRFRVTPYKLSRGQTIYAYFSNEAGTLTDYVAPPQNNEATSNSSTSSSSQSSGSENATTATVTKVSKPKKPTISKLKTSKKTITVYWKKMSASGFQVQYSTSSSFKNAKTVTVKGSGKAYAKIKGLKKGKKYYVRVRAYKTVNGKKAYGSWSAKKSITAK